MIRHPIALIGLAVITVAVPALAQTPPRPTPQPPGPATRPTTPFRFDNVGRVSAPRTDFENFLDGASGNNLPPQSLARIDLANRVSTLIELGRCDEARATAREAGDLQMALRARQICRADRIERQDIDRASTGY